MLHNSLTKINLVGTQKTRLNEVLFRTEKQMLKLMDKKIFTILGSIFFISTDAL